MRRLMVLMLLAVILGYPLVPMFRVAEAQPPLVVAFVHEYSPTWGDEGASLTINYRARLLGAGVPDKQIEFAAYFTFIPTGANPINQMENALVDSLVAEAALLGVTLSRTATFIPTYKRGN